MVEDEEPESTVLVNGEDFFYVFIVDRSGSMGGRRIEVTKEALKLFMQSLPPKCKFQIMSFGTNYSPMPGKQAFFTYDQSTMETAIKHIAGMEADFGGTNILKPLSHVIDQAALAHKQTRIFMLTDGQVSDRQAVINKSHTGKDNIRIHTFGIGNGCDANMVERMAQKGRGSCSLVGDNSDNLNGLVITALKRASEPSLQGCSFAFGEQREEIGEMFRNESFSRC